MSETSDVGAAGAVYVHAPDRPATAAVLGPDGVVTNVLIVDADAPPVIEGATVRVLQDGEQVAAGDRWNGKKWTPPAPADPATAAPAEVTVEQLQAQLAAFIALVADHTTENVQAAVDVGAITDAQAVALTPTASTRTTTSTTAASKA